MSSVIKFPTLLGLAILVAGIAGGTFLVNKVQIFKSQANQSNTPKTITLVNVSANSASIYWQTDSPTTGFIEAGSSYSLGLTFRDERDSSTPTVHQLHFVTLTNLIPNTTYYYKITSGGDSYPQSNFPSFKTSPQVTPSSRQPLIGTVLDTNSQPIKEAIVTLQIPGAQTLATITKEGGNFILPLTEIHNSFLEDIFNFPTSTTSANLTVFNTQNQSKVVISIPSIEKVLPPIILGKDFDFTEINKTATPAALPTPDIGKYDLNGDGVINSLDMAMVLKNFGKHPKNKKADLNGDGVVDQQDVNLINKMIPHNSLSK